MRGLDNRSLEILSYTQLLIIDMLTKFSVLFLLSEILMVFINNDFPSVGITKLFFKPISNLKGTICASILTTFDILCFIFIPYVFGVLITLCSSVRLRCKIASKRPVDFLASLRHLFALDFSV